MKRTAFALLILVALIVIAGAASYLLSPEQRAIRHTVAFVGQHLPDPAWNKFSDVGNYHRERRDWVVCGWVGPEGAAPKQFILYHNRQTGADRLVTQWSSTDELYQRSDASCASNTVWKDEQ